MEDGIVLVVYWDVSEVYNFHTYHEPLLILTKQKHRHVVAVCLMTNPPTLIGPLDTSSPLGLKARQPLRNAILVTGSPLSNSIVVANYLPVAGIQRLTSIPPTRGKTTLCYKPEPLTATSSRNCDV